MKMNKKKQAEAIKKYVRLADYLSASQIFLRDNFFLEKKLEQKDLKKRFLGHWGTCPGINFVYANLNNLIVKHKKNILLTVGVGHGFPAYQANIFLEKTLSKFYQNKIPYTKKGWSEIVENFSTPYGYPSHLNPEAPGTILEGGELGYSLAVATGTVLDNKKIINAVIIGDGEAETGPLAASWNVNKFINPKHDGAVLPILHLNGYKISGPTIFGRMKDKDIQKYFEALGWEPYFIDEKKGNLFEQGVEIFEKAYQQIDKIQKQGPASSRRGRALQRWPMIVLRTEKGRGTVRKVGEKKIEGNCFAHQIVFDNLSNDKKQLQQLEKWLQSYRINELINFDKNGKLKLDSDIQALIPKISQTIGSNKFSYGSETMKDLPKISKSIVKTSSSDSSMHIAGKYFYELMNKTEKERNFRIFSPDETYSNKLDTVFKTTSRAWMLSTKEWDLDLDQNKKNGGRVVEILSEHVLFGMLWGYTLSGRHGVFPTYESFAQITASMADQYVKFLKASQNVYFRKKVPALNVILTSLLERQDHNGFSHQNPSFISNNLDRDDELVDVYFPADKDIMHFVLEKTLHSVNKLNVIVAGKKMTKKYSEWGLQNSEIKELITENIAIWNFASDQAGKNSDLIIVTCGDYVTEEALAGVKLFKERLPQIKLRFVNILNLDVLTNSTKIEKYFAKNKERGIVLNYHGYPATIKKMLFGSGLENRIIINGYEEYGSTTSPFDMKARNGLSRFHLVQDLAELAVKQKLISLQENRKVQTEMKNFLQWEKDYIKKYKVDPEVIKNWKW